MCILFVANRVHGDYPLIIAANRDEFFSRPTLGLHRWSDPAGITGGRDQRGGGGWLAVNRDGRIAAVTNLRAPHLRQEGALSRGELVVRWLTSGEDRQAFESFLQANYRLYNPFNMLYGDVGKLSVFSCAAPAPESVAQGFLSMSNGPMPDNWPKMSRGVEMLQKYIDSNVHLEPGHLLELMQDNSRVDWSQLPASGIPVDYEEALSSIFVDSIGMTDGNYGTRSTSVLVWDGRELHFTEYTHGTDGEVTAQVTETVVPV